MPNCSVDNVLDKKILKTKPSARVKIEKMVIITTDLNNDFIISPQKLFYMFIK